jgi:hypothetical protein
MNQTIELSPKQFESLKTAFTKKHGISVLGLSREMKCDTAMAKNLIRQLLDIDFLADYKNGNHGVTREGRDYLIKMKVPGADRKPIGRPREENDYVDPYDMPPSEKAKPELSVLKDVPLEELEAASKPNDEPNKVIVVSTPEGEDKIREQFTGGVDDKINRTRFATWEQEGGWHFKASPDPAEPVPPTPESSFAYLVSAGLKRLNERLGFKPVEIQNLELKIETLTKLAGSVSPASIEVAQILTEIAQDLKNAGGVK